jgi:hypothetical protein
VLDDPFVTFDDVRAARAALLLREISSDFQVIYLACSNRYDGLADVVVELPGPTETEAPAGPLASRASSQAAAALETEPNEPSVEPESSVAPVTSDSGSGTVIQMPPSGLANSLLEQADVSPAEVAGADEDSDSDGPIQFATAVEALRGQDEAGPDLDETEAPRQEPDASPRVGETVGETRPEPGEVR